MQSVELARTGYGDNEHDSALRSDEPADSRRSPDLAIGKEETTPGSLSRWVGSGEAMAGHAGCLVTECMEGRDM